MNLVIASVASTSETLLTASGLIAFTIFALAGALFLVGGYKVFDKLTPGDLHGKIFEGNTATAILAGSVIIGLAIILAGAM